MKQSPEIANLAAALVKAQAEMRPIVKDSTNPDYRSSYASLDAIVEAVRPILAKHGLAIVQGTTTPESDANSKITGFAVETMLVHSSGEWLTSAVVMPVQGRMLKGGGRAEADAQSAGSAISYGRRYGICALLSLTTGEDDDGRAASKQRSEAKGSRTGGVQSSSTAAQTGSQPQRAPTAQPVPAVTRESFVSFAPAFKDGTAPTIGELPYKFLQFVLEVPEKRIPAGFDRDSWIAAFRKEIDGREAGEFTMRTPVGAGV